MTRTTKSKRLCSLAAFALLVFGGTAACSSSSSKSPAGTGGSAGSDSNYTCAVCSCQPNSSLRPTNVYQVMGTLLDALQGKGDSGSTYIGMMPNHGSSFWTVPKIGYGVAQQEIGCLGDFELPPPKADPIDEIVQAQVDFMTDWTSDGGDLPKASGIVLSCKSAPDLVKPINDAIAAGINVITIDSDSVDSDRLMYLGTLNEPAGETAGKEMLRMLGTDTTSVAVILGGNDGEPNSDGRIAGIQQAFMDANRADQLDVAHLTGDADVPTALDAAQKMYGDKLGGAFALNSTFGPLAGDWVVSQNLAGKAKLVVWDVSDATNTHIANGVIQVALAQKSYFYGYLSTYVLYAMSTLGVQQTMTLLAPYLSGPKGDLLDTGVDLVTPDNLADYGSYQSECLGVTMG
jgi:ribose transport system substrate-binding protein